jgi:hypothetical protein
MGGAMNVPTILGERREFTKSRLETLKKELSKAGADKIAEGSACVYATGSGGRGEMSERSDLDIFIVQYRDKANSLSNLDEIRLKARLIEASRTLKFEDFSGDGEYVKTYDVKRDLIDKLGTRHDDYENVLTARLLLLLESQAILNEVLYKETIGALVANYWRDYPKNSASFLPVFLMNDILRFWKTLCLNYEERTGDAKTDLHEDPPTEDLKARGKRRLHNYKLKYSRMLTCYSAIIYLMAVNKRDGGTVAPEVAMEMVTTSPTQRLERVAEIDKTTSTLVETILASYASFLKVCEEEKGQLQQKFGEADFKKARFDEAREFGRSISALLHAIGESSDLLRYLIV